MTGISQTNIAGNPYVLYKKSFEKNNTINEMSITNRGITNPVVKKERKSSLSSLKKSVAVECMIPIDKKGIRNNILVLKRLSRPFSDGRI